MEGSVDMGEMHEMYGAWDNGDYNPFEGDVDEDDADDRGGSCLNCGIEFTHPVPRLFCSDLCRDEASLVRYVRACSADGRLADPDVHEAVEIKMAHVLAGGYDRRGRQLSREVRDAVIARDSGKCQMCGGAGTEIDHIADSSDNLDNLQLLCHACHVVKTQASFRKVSPGDPDYPEVNARRNALMERFYSPKSLRECDDPNLWKARSQQLMAERRALWGR
jgi:5-methylcytosine-specific restriction endonuclease McrA